MTENVMKKAARIGIYGAAGGGLVLATQGWNSKLLIDPLGSGNPLTSMRGVYAGVLAGVATGLLTDLLASKVLPGVQGEGVVQTEAKVLNAAGGAGASLLVFSLLNGGSVAQIGALPIAISGALASAGADYVSSSFSGNVLE